jgi:hypothetical protein
LPWFIFAISITVESTRRRLRLPSPRPLFARQLLSAKPRFADNY